ncbi:MAG: C40 family peptidase, partial [Synergistaceae bacterium]|nr:C40 family peptidase [Synergistaceae bacterium]
MKKLLLILFLVFAAADASFSAETGENISSGETHAVISSTLSVDVVSPAEAQNVINFAENGENVSSVDTGENVVSSDETPKTHAVVIVPSAPLIADDETRDDEVLYGMTMKAALSGDYVILEMPYGTLPIEAKNVQLITQEEAEEWSNSVTHNIIAPFADIQSEAKTQSFPPIITLPRGARVKIGEINSDDARYVQAELFGGVKGWIRRPLIRPVRRWNVEGEEITRKNLVDDAKLYLGTSYRWGGQTPEGVDCSGLVHMAYILNGLEVFRNSRPKQGFPISLKHIEGLSNDTHTLETLKSLKPGDTIHWAGHVGLYLGNGKFIHANGRDFSTTIASLISGDENYREDIARPSSINTFGTVYPDEPEKLSVKEFYTRSFTSGDKVGYRFYVRAEGYAPSRAILYPEGLSSDAVIEISNDVKLWRFVYSARDTERAPEYFYAKPGKYTPAVELINETGYRPSGKTITSGIYEMKELLNVITSAEIYEIKAAETKAIDKKTSPDIPSGFVLISEFAPEILQE